MNTSLKNASQKKSLEEEDKLNEKYEGKNEIILGTFYELPKHFQDNEYIKRGYLLNCNTKIKALKSLFILSNESVNVWSHLLGAIFFFFLIWYTAIFITNYRTQLANVKREISQMEKETNNLSKNDNILLNSFIKSFEDFKSEFNNYINLKSLYETSSIKLNVAYEKVLEYVHFSNLTNSFSGFFDIFTLKFVDFREKLLDLMELEHVAFGRNEDIDENSNSRLPKKLRRWPLFIFLVSAILCLSFSTTYHLIGRVSTEYYRIFSRFDYAGISLLITGSCFPPYYYFFYCETFFRIFYLTFMSIFGLTTFGLSLTNEFYTPRRRKFRGRLFLSFGISAGIPILHTALLGKYMNGYIPNIRLIFWYLGGISYILGGILYIIRFPEKQFPGKFDFFGSSHQLFHILVIFGVVFHYIGCLDSYYSRFDHMCKI